MMISWLLLDERNIYTFAGPINNKKAFPVELNPQGKASNFNDAYLAIKPQI